MAARTSHKVRLVAWIGGTIGGVALAFAASPAGAATPSIDVATPTIAPSGATDVTATFSSPDNLLQVSILVTPAAGATGTVTIAPVSSTGAALSPCDQATSTRIDCFWQESSGPDGTVTVTATASADATGTFQVTTTQTCGVEGCNTVDEPVAGPTPIVVQVPEPPTTTAAPTTTTAPSTTAPSTTAPATTAGPPTTSVTLPNTGSGTTLALAGLGAAVLAVGATAILVARRSDAPS